MKISATVPNMQSTPRAKVLGKGKGSAMAASTQTNSNARKERARKAGKCQLCGSKTKGHSVTVDYEKKTVTKSAAGKAKQGHAFYCSDCADKKVRRYEWKLTRRSTKSTTGNGSRKQRKRGGAAKATAPKRVRKAKAPAKAKRVRKPKAAKAGAAKAASSADPF